MLVDFITSVQALNDRKDLIQGLLTKLQKPMTEQMSAAAGSGSITLIAAVQKDGTGNPYAFLAPLSAPITFARKSSRHQVAGAVHVLRSDGRGLERERAPLHRGRHLEGRGRDPGRREDVR